jgi:hypothetical protein
MCGATRDVRFGPTDSTYPLEGAECPLWVKSGHVECKSDICFTTESGHVRCNYGCPLWANSGHCTSYSISSSARPISVFGTVRPSALAVLRLMINSNLVACTTGNSAGFSPLRTLPI